MQTYVLWIIISNNILYIIIYNIFELNNSTVKGRKC